MRDENGVEDLAVDKTSPGGIHGRPPFLFGVEAFGGVGARLGIGYHEANGLVLLDLHIFSWKNVSLAGNNICHFCLFHAQKVLQLVCLSELSWKHRATMHVLP